MILIVELSTAAVLNMNGSVADLTKLHQVLIYFYFPFPSNPASVS